ncbi:MAG TPA: AAA family ATPase [Pirellulales bacterium]|nr:AAA family ATPase [Pirellulales bacterium]
MARSHEEREAMGSFDALGAGSAFLRLLAAATEPANTSCPPPQIQGPDHHAQGADWLWERKLAPGEVTILAGAPGKGFVAADIMARALNGAAFPCDANRGDAARRMPLPVLVAAQNRDTFDSIEPRVSAAGGDTERLRVLPCFHVVDAVADAEDDAANDDAANGPIARSAIDQVDDLLAVLPAPTLVIIDPVPIRLARRGAELHPETAFELRDWAAIARRWRAAVLVVTGALPSNANRALNALGASGEAGTILALHRDDKSLDDRRYLVPFRSARSSDRDSLVLVIGPPEGAAPGAVAGVKWRTTTIKTAEALELAAAKPVRGGPQADELPAPGRNRRFGQPHQLSLHRGRPAPCPRQPPGPAHHGAIRRHAARARADRPRRRADVVCL